MIFWKTAWLRTLDKDLSAFEVDIRRTGGNEAPLVSEEDVVACARKTDADDGVPVYACQATELPAATQALGPWDLKQYVEDFASGNVGLWRMLKSFLLVAYRRGLVNLGIGLGPVLKWMYDKAQGLIGGVEYPFRDGKIPAGSRTPTAVLELKPGELVRVKSQSEIVATLDTTRRNRGMTFDPEMVPYCGGTFPVLQRVSRIIHEKSGRMIDLKNPCVILDSVICQARYCDNRLFCPRAGYPYWRELWLERVIPTQQGADGAGQSKPDDVAQASPVPRSLSS